MTKKDKDLTIEALQSTYELLRWIVMELHASSWQALGFLRNLYKLGKIGEKLQLGRIDEQTLGLVDLLLCR